MKQVKVGDYIRINDSRYQLTRFVTMMIKMGFRNKSQCSECNTGEYGRVFAIKNYGKEKYYGINLLSGKQTLVTSKAICPIDGDNRNIYISNYSLSVTNRNLGQFGCKNFSRKTVNGLISFKLLGGEVKMLGENIDIYKLYKILLALELETVW